MLGSVADVPMELNSKALNVLPVKKNLSGALLEVSREDIHKGALTRAVRPQQAVDSRSQCGADSFQSLLAAVIFLNVFKFQFHGSTLSKKGREFFRALSLDTACTGSFIVACVEIRLGN